MPLFLLSWLLWPGRWDAEGWESEGKRSKLVGLLHGLWLLSLSFIHLSTSDISGANINNFPLLCAESLQLFIHRIPERLIAKLKLKYPNRLWRNLCINLTGFARSNKPPR